MPNITEIDSFLTTINTIQTNFSRYGYLIIFILGNIGSLLNILVLTRPNYLRNSCSSYILASTLPNLLIINIVILFRILATFDFDLTSKSRFFCKFQWYISHSMTLLSRTYILLACIDRWAMTSTIVRRRAFARMKISMTIIPMAGIIWSLVSIHVLTGQKRIKGQCVLGSNSYAIFFNVYNTVLVGLVIPILMTGFSLVTIRNVKQLQNRVNHRAQIIHTIIINRANHPSAVNKKSYDYQLLFMVLVQIFVYIITNFPFVIHSIYVTITINCSKSSIQLAIENLALSIAYVLVITNFCTTFYIYILTSATFRKDLKRLLLHNRFMDQLFGNGHNPQVGPRPNTIGNTR
ncbi:unnamed protein product [Adineta steineri]|uniref:G-protein coupled receptors family 1 profile domain-containing protein n=1 Tax=Adineta steineri TaxID=433720 RepID=A0A819UNV1_9BILA|nr:unnamed protein product [Adineta steineri]CAF4098038.1 unnamed protein product [Adineta steineri]